MELSKLFPQEQSNLNEKVSSSSNSRGRPVTPSTYYELGSAHNINSKTPEKHIERGCSEAPVPLLFSFLLVSSF